MEPRQFVVGRQEERSRLDAWLVRKMPDLSRGQVKHLIDQGKILVNHRRVLIAGWELEAGDDIEVRIPSGGLPEGKERGKEKPAEPLKRDRFLDVVYEDRDILVVNKPAGVLTEPKQDSPYEHLLGMIRGYMKRKFKESRGSYIKLMHRLDRETSGVVVAALSKVGEQLEEQFRRHRVEKYYVALVQGRVEGERGRIDLELEKGEFGEGKKARAVLKGKGLEALTEYVVEERYGDATLLDVLIRTGRTHQIRVHFAEMGHPLIGDRTYGGRISFPRHALHARRLVFKHPRTGSQSIFEVPLPEDLDQLIDQLRG